MEIKGLKRFNIWKVICVLLVISVIILVISLITTEAKYRFTASYPAAYGTVHFKSNDLEVLAVNIENDSGGYDSSDTIPTSGYVLNEEESYCGLSNGDGTYTHDTSITINYHDGVVGFDNITKKGTKCFLYFDIQLSGLDVILANNTVDTSRKTGSIYTEDTAGRIFEGPADDYGDTTYFFAGANPNNWVKFAGFYWRIIRVNGNGSLRLIYNGTDTTTTGTTTQLSSTSAFNSNNNDNAYVGYMYGTAGSSTYAETHANTNSSAIKGVLDTWYSSNLASYASYLDTDVGFCGDRAIDSSYGTDLGYGTNKTGYMARNRLNTNKTPILTCPQSADLYTVSTSNYGNKALTYPIGLITADEVSYAGGYYQASNSSYWLYTGKNYWTMTPILFTGDNSLVLYVYYQGHLNWEYTSDANGVRPVINLKSTIYLSSGDGTSENPYVVS